MVVGLEMFYYLEDQAAFLTEVARVLRPGGTIMLSMPNPERHAFQPSPFSTHYASREELVKAMSTAGFTTTLYDCLPVQQGSPAREAARRALVTMHLMPRSIEGRARLKRLVSRDMRPLESIDVDPTRGFEGLTRLSSPAEADGYAIMIAVGDRLAS